MAQIIENLNGRRLVRISTDDIIALVKTYQTISMQCKSYEDLRNKLGKAEIYLPEDY